MLIPAPHVHWRRCAGGGTAVLDLGSWQCHMFHGNGARVWDAITLRGDLSGLAEEIAIPAGADVASVRESIDAYAESLCAMGLLVDPAVPRRRRWWWFR
ncbi:hypothetical protein [Streptomyces noursei]|uniref:Uncharacterized protein n=1 Tax=Streptomyces noursei TaxID=1971 RepID=A0A2N8PR03_STRNR|nr:hypothetical protein [Streptomyces noursei]PNE43466.1 hypothetical protein AOB60_00640 [Streptomyces noursei]